MKDFSKQMGKYTKLGKDSSKNIEVLDQMFYRQYKRQMFGSRVEEKIEKAHEKNKRKKLHKQLKAINSPVKEEYQKNWKLIISSSIIVYSLLQKLSKHMNSLHH